MTPTNGGETTVNLAIAGQIAALAGALQLIKDTGASKEHLTPLAKETTAQSASDHAILTHEQTQPLEKLQSRTLAGNQTP